MPAYLPEGVSAVTREHTKIIPDGLLTPGSHVEYFFRSQTVGEDPGPRACMMPDTNRVFPQPGEESTDGHRWQEFSVLPDRWKDSQYRHPVYATYGPGMARLLVIDANDRRGNERVWVSVADTIGDTLPERWGAHNGWHARGDQDVNDPAARVHEHGGHPGTTWDMYQVKASEALTLQAGSIGSRLAFRGEDPLLAAKSSRQGPTLEMLNAYYRLILLLTGDLNAGTLGPFSNRSQNDAGILMQWLQAGSPFDSAHDRGIWAIGDGFVADNATYLDGGPQDRLMSEGFRVKLVSDSYFELTGDHATTADLKVFSEWQGKFPASAKVYGIRNLCLLRHDVMEPSTTSLTATTSEYQRSAGPQGGPYYAGVFKDHDASSPWMALVNGWDIENLTSRNDVNTLGRHEYFHGVFTNVWAPIWQVALGPCCTDVRSSYGGALANFMSLRNNPLVTGEATIRFGLVIADWVEARVYDLSGRLVRTLAEGRFPAGEHILTWDGLDDQGRRLPRGMYFTRLRYRGSGFAEAKKLTILK